MDSRDPLMGICFLWVLLLFYHIPLTLTSCSILYSLVLLASVSSASLQAFCVASSSCRTRVFKRAAEASLSFSERLLSSRRCCRDFTVAPATA